MLSSAQIQDLKTANPLELLVKEHVKLRLIAGELHGPCPLQCAGGYDRFIVWPSEDRYYCRQCESKGDQFDYLKQRLGFSFQQAVEYLGEGGGTSSSNAPSPRALQPSKEPTPDPFDQVSDLDRRSLIENWQEELNEGEGNSAKVFDPPCETPLQYLYAMRNLEPDAVEKFQLGFNPEPFELCGRTVPAGISIPLMSGQEIVGLKIRTYKPEAPKYWRMGRGSYCLNKDSLRQHRQVIVTEGELDCILLDQIVGDRYAVVTFGGTSDVAKADLPLLFFNSERVYWAFDGDEAGYTQAKKYDGANKRYRNLILPEGEDISSFFLKTGINRANPQGTFLEWFENAIQEGFGND